MADMDVKKTRWLKIGEYPKQDKALYFWFGEQREKAKANVKVEICF